MSMSVLKKKTQKYDAALILTEIKISNALFKWPKNYGAPRPAPTLIFSPKSPDQNSEIAILFTIVEKPNNYIPSA